MRSIRRRIRGTRVLQITTELHSRLRVLGAPPRDHLAEFARDVRAGLTSPEKTLPSKYLYDDVGSALFERICELPEYYLTRAEQSILERSADAIAEQLDGTAALVELGSGNSRKTALLIDALLRRNGRLHYVPIDISSRILMASAARLLRERPGLEITALAADYESALRRLPREVGGPAAIAWLGSSVGNFDRDAARVFVRRLVQATDGGALLIGIDMRKRREVLEAAYDDAQGITARFNRNLLERINRELDGRFRPGRFRYEARYDEAAGSVDMRQISTCAQTVRIGALRLDVAFTAGEPIHTERSLKYHHAEIAELARDAEAQVAAQWHDPARRFTLNLLTATDAAG